ncbi:MAG: methylmalonyl-CoA epimerase [Armatimonadota bacterium]|nr:methylmalonyl-CoA epimerase [Armatimonadota bacterium]MDR5696939.1 methylmalonyl-CoA epimerase [Armatimonadota bacterium]
MTLSFHHIGIAVRSLDDALRRYGGLGLAAAWIEEVPSEGVRVAFLPLAAGAIELLEPTSPDGPVARFLQTRGEGVHHIALQVPDIHRALERAARSGLRTVGKAPRPGSHSTLVAFLHPKDTAGALIELVQPLPPDVSGR